MRERSGKTIRGIYYGAGIIVLLGLSCIAGICMERGHQKRLEQQKEDVATIAVVNMDDGVTVDHEQINYASQLISFPDGDFTTVGLTDARAGIENGTYAAYIVIPETFSTSVTSIEYDPRKTVLEYRYNPNLADTARMQAMSNVNEFITMLNSNIAYMYVDAVLTEFHRIQDDSSTILANDNAELELLESVDAALLIEAAERVEETVVDNNIQPVELTPYAAQNDTLLESMLVKYVEAVQQAQDDYAAIQETRVTIDTAADEFFSVYASVVYDTNAEQANILSEGKTMLADAVETYNLDIDGQRGDIETLIAELIASNEKTANEQLGIIIAGIEMDRKTITKAFRETVEGKLTGEHGSCQDSISNWLENIVAASYKMGYERGCADAKSNGNTVSGNSVSENTHSDPDAVSGSNVISEQKLNQYADEYTGNHIDQYINDLNKILENEISNIDIQWVELNIQLPNEPEDSETEKPEDTDNSDAGAAEGDTGGSGTDAAEGDAGGSGTSAAGLKYSIILPKDGSDTVDEILEQFHLKYEPDEVSGVIQTYFVDRLRDVHQGQMAKLDDAENVLYQRMDEYEYQLEHYDPLSYIRAADLGTYIDNIEDNARGMLDVVEQNNAEYRTYAEDVYMATSEHTSQLVDSLNVANTQTTENIESCIDELKSSRETLNSRNVNMLEGFTESLAYTRVGSQENVEVYDYIVNPVLSGAIGEDLPVNDTPDSGNGLSVRTLLIVFLGIGIAVCLAGILLSIRGQRKSRKGNIH